MLPSHHFVKHKVPLFRSLGAVQIGISWICCISWNFLNFLKIFFKTDCNRITLSSYGNWLYEPPAVPRKRIILSSSRSKLYDSLQIGWNFSGVQLAASCNRIILSSKRSKLYPDIQGAPRARTYELISELLFGFTFSSFQTEHIPKFPGRINKTKPKYLRLARGTADWGTLENNNRESWSRDQISSRRYTVNLVSAGNSWSRQLFCHIS